jgi:hypothetical protein
LQPWQSKSWLESAQIWLNERFPTACPLEPITVWDGAFCGFSSVRRRKLHLKALPLELAREVKLTPILRSFSNLIPEVAAIDEKNRWLLTWSGGERHLVREPKLECWLETLRGLAELQIKTLPYFDALQNAGCAKLEPVRVLEEAQVLLCSSRNEHASSALATLNGIELESLELLPSALAHGDFHPMNVIAPNCIIDWSDAMITHPFVDLERFLTWIMGSSRNPHPWSPFTDTLALEPAMISAYLEPWCVYAPLERLREAFNATRPFGLVVLLVCNAKLATARSQGLTDRFTKQLAQAASLQKL